jgi:hypothetical protein
LRFLQKGVVIAFLMLAVGVSSPSLRRSDSVEPFRILVFSGVALIDEVCG